MKCPLLVIGYLAIGDQKVNAKSECLKKGCAWWSSEADACAVMITAGSLAGLVATGDTILEKMPHEKVE